MSRNRTSQKKPVKPLSDTNRDRRARRGQKQASPKPTPAPPPEPAPKPPVAPQDAALLPAFARELLPVPPDPAVPTPDPVLPTTDQVVEGLLEQLSSATPPDRTGLPTDHPAHRLSTVQWVRLQITLEAMGRGENVWRAIREVMDYRTELDEITRQILSVGEPTAPERQSFGEPE